MNKGHRDSRGRRYGMLELEGREWRVTVETEGFSPSLRYGTAPGEARIAFIPPCSPTCHLVPESVPGLAAYKIKLINVDRKGVAFNQNATGLSSAKKPPPEIRLGHEGFKGKKGSHLSYSLIQQVRVITILCCV